MTKSEELNAYKLELKIEKLKSILEAFNNQIKSGEKNKKELELLIIKAVRLSGIINYEELKLKILKTDKLLKNKEIALVNNTDLLEGKYNIYRTSDCKKVGFISFFPDYYDSEIGSIGYDIGPSYRGNNYAYKALCLLSDYLISNGVNNISIVTTNDNIPSLSVMEKFKENAEATDKSEGLKTIKKYNYVLRKKDKIGEE